MYFVDARGLVTGSPFGQAQFGSPLDTRDVGAANADPALEAEGAEQLSLQTGGFSVRNSNDLAGALRRIGRESEMYYLLGFRPTGAGRSGAFRRIESASTTRRPGSRATRLLRRRSARRRKSDAAKALDDELSARDRLALRPGRRAAAGFGVRVRRRRARRALTLLAVEADLRAFAFSRGAGGALGDTLELRATVTEQATGATERYERDVAMTFPATVEVRCRPLAERSRRVPPRPGRYQARIAVRDKNSQRIGTRHA